MITPRGVILGRPGDERHTSNVSLPDPDPPDLPVPDDGGLRPDANGRIDGTSALVSRISSSSDSGDSAESQTEIDQTELHRQALHLKAAEKLSKMDVINPEVLRVTPAYRAFERCAQALRVGKDDDLYFKSEKSDKISTFWSPHLTAQYTAKKPAFDEVAATASHAEDGVLTNHMGNAQPISDEKLKELRRKYDKDDNGLSWTEFRELAVEVGELQGLKTPVSQEKLKKIFEGLDADKSGVVSIQEFEAAYAMLEKQLQAAAKAKAKAKAKGKAKAEGKAKPKPKPKAAAPAPAEAEGSIFDALPGFGSFVPDLSGLSELPSVLEDTRVPQARPIPTPKKTKPPPLPEASPPALSTQVPWSTQLKAADPDWYDEDDAGYSSNSLLDAGELPDAPDAEAAAPAPEAPAKAQAPKPAPKPAVAKPKVEARAGSPKAKAKVNVAKPKVQPKGRAQGISAMDGVTDDIFLSPIHRREAVAHPTDRADPQAVRVLQTGGGMDMVQQDPEVLSEPESQDSVDSISGEIARSWDPSAKDVRYSYARDRAVGFSEFWRPLKWSEAEWEWRLQASGNLKRTVARAKLNEPKAKPKAAPVQETADEPEDLIAPEKPKPRSQYPLATEVKPKYIDVPLKGLQGVAAESAVGALRKNAKQIVAPVFEQSLDDELLGALPPTVPPARSGEPEVPLSSVAPAHLRERPAQPASPQTPPESPIDAPRFGYPSWQAPPLYTGPGRTFLRPMMQEVQPPAEEQPVTGEYGDRAGRTWL